MTKLVNCHEFERAARQSRVGCKSSLVAALQDAWCTVDAPRNEGMRQAGNLRSSDDEWLARRTTGRTEFAKQPIDDVVIQQPGSEY
jgi:hypothetical protein